MRHRRVSLARAAVVGPTGPGFFILRSRVFYSTPAAIVPVTRMPGGNRRRARAGHFVGDRGDSRRARVGHFAGNRGAGLRACADLDPARASVRKLCWLERVPQSKPLMCKTLFDEI